jgi:hypothetical protein
MEVAFGKRFLKRFFSIVIFLGCAIFVAYRQRLSKIGFEFLDRISKKNLEYSTTFVAFEPTCSSMAN